MRALFVHDRDDLASDAPPGGVQRCTAEFLAIVRAAATQTETIPIERSRDPLRRLRRKLHLGSYLSYAPGELAAPLGAILSAGEITHAFLNRAELSRLAPLIRRLSPPTRVFVMSHGNQSGDDLYEIAGEHGRRKGLARWSATWQLGLDLVTESHERRRHIDGVCAMSAEEAALERWLGAPRVMILPRLIAPAPLPWSPQAQRIGYIGTLDHTPNRVALLAVCAALHARGFRGELRLVGGPTPAGVEFTARFPFVHYLGPLPDAALGAEAGTWSVFLNPILWLARGASMKLAQALAWGLPVVTTLSGRRGYEWNEGEIATTEDRADAFAAATLALLNDPSRLATARRASLAAARSAPNVAELGRRLTAFVSLPSAPHP